MSTKHLSQTKFAIKLDIKRQAVNQAINKGQLVKHGKGRASYIDLDCPKTKAYIKSSSANRHRSRMEKPASKPKAASPPKDKKKSAPELPDNDESVEAYADKQRVERLKRLEEIEKLNLNNRTTRMELIERDLIQMFMDKMYTIHNGQLKTLGLRTSSDLAAIFGIEDNELIRKACDKIDKDVFTIMKQIKREMKEFLKKISPQKTKKKRVA